MTEQRTFRGWALWNLACAYVASEKAEDIEEALLMAADAMSGLTSRDPGPSKEDDNSPSATHIQIAIDGWQITGPLEGRISMVPLPPARPIPVPGVVPQARPKAR